jgi:hypothetical protein
VSNGSGRPGVERAALAQFGSFGFREDGTGVAPRHDVPETEVHAAPDDIDAAGVVDAYLSSGVTIVPDPTLRPGHVVVVLGRDLPHVRPPVKPADVPQPRACGA